MSVAGSPYVQATGLRMRPPELSLRHRAPQEFLEQQSQYPTSHRQSRYKTLLAPRSRTRRDRKRVRRPARTPRIVPGFARSDDWLASCWNLPHCFGHPIRTAL